jgi:hypothetical protein
MDLRKYRQAIVGGLKWVISQQRPDGTFQPIEFGMCGYHKLPYMLACSPWVSALGLTSVARALRPPG